MFGYSALTVDDKADVRADTTPRKPSVTLIRVPPESCLDQENADETNHAPVTSHRGGKRKAGSDDGGDSLAGLQTTTTSQRSPAAKRRKAVKKTAKTKSSKPAKEMAKGQKRLTDFFRV